MLNIKQSLISYIPLIQWARWIKHSYSLTKKYPTSKLHYDAWAYNCILGQYTTLYNGSKLSGCMVGDYSFVAEMGIVSNTTIGKFCSIGPGIKSGYGTHPARDFVSTHPVFYSTLKQAQVTFADKNYFEEKRVIICNDVWIGANVYLADGITINNGAIVGAGAVVTKDVPAYAVVGGVPAKLIRYRFKEKDIEFLQQFKWWDKDYNWISRNWRLWHNIDIFVEELNKLCIEDLENSIKDQ